MQASLKIYVTNQYLLEDSSLHFETTVLISPYHYESVEMILTSCFHLDLVVALTKQLILSLMLSIKFQLPQ